MQRGIAPLAVVAAAGRRAGEDVMRRIGWRGRNRVSQVEAVLGRPRALSAATWRQAVPVLDGALVTLREPRLTDAQALWATVATEEVSKFMSAPPSTVEGFERFIAWSVRERSAGMFVCYAVLPHGMDEPVGIFQLRRLDTAFSSAEWGFAIGSAWWSRGIYVDAAALLLDFAFTTVGVRRLEARVAVDNRRGNGALRKTGARLERVLERSLVKNGECLDQALWVIREPERRRTTSAVVLARLH
jgi:RimJ/RimL family protein N-acetyltransferase